MELKIGFIGTGNIAHSHVHRLRQIDGVRIVSMADPSEASRERIRERFQLQKIAEFDDHVKMLAECELDAVVICSPHTLHYRHAMDALSAGMHVLVEKPLTCTSQAAKNLTQKADEMDKILQVSFQRHFIPAFMYIRDVIADGTIGPLTSVTATLYQDWKDAQAGTWRQNPALSGGGMLMDSGSHIIDVMLWTTGLHPVKITTQMHLQGAPVEADTFTTIQFEEGAVGSLNIVGKTPEKIFIETYAFIGEKGAVFYENGKIRLHRNGFEPIEPELPKAVTNSDLSFIEAVRGNSAVAVPGQYALKVLQLTEAIYKEAGYEPVTAAEEMKQPVGR